MIFKGSARLAKGLIFARPLDLSPRPKECVILGCYKSRPQKSSLSWVWDGI